ncbi:MAG: MerR family transcriptional regulator, aldehyde-responsive regulator [Mycobacterium sp.]|jgi:hypothetical protein|nr:MerR family transcriptional regulator, aldehyde-responsive regulator [Mycobacterium sp.]
MTTDTTLTSELTIQQVSTPPAESALRYYERIGLIDAVPRDASSGHRRYPADLVATIESLSCLRTPPDSTTDRPAAPARALRHCQGPNVGGQGAR